MTITEALVAEHRVFLSVFDQIEGVLARVTAPGEIKTMAKIVEGLLKGHADAEANLAYLALDHILADKGQLERLHHDHQEIDRCLQKVQVAPTCAEARRLLSGALRASREHFAGEETSVFPLLEKTLAQETLRELGQAWRKGSSEVKPSPVRLDLGLG